MPAANFATRSKHGPNPAGTLHLHGGGTTQYTCHMAAMHWAFMDLGDTDAVANSRVTAIIQAKCTGCTAGGHLHGSISSNWYGAQFCGVGAVAIPNRAALYNAVNVGDVLVTSIPANPMHTMVVVQKSTMLGRHFVYIRGFNNVGTLGTGPHLAYDNSDRDIDKAALWHTQGVSSHLGLSYSNGADLYVIPYANYSGRAAIVRNNCNNAGAAWAYVGP